MHIKELQKKEIRKGGNMACGNNTKLNSFVSIPQATKRPLPSADPIRTPPLTAWLMSGFATIRVTGSLRVTSGRRCHPPTGLGKKGRVSAPLLNLRAVVGEPPPLRWDVEGKETRGLDPRHRGGFGVPPFGSFVSN